MLDIGERVIVRFKGEPYYGIIRKMKWNLFYVDFETRKGEWIDMKRLERINNAAESSTTS